MNHRPLASLLLAGALALAAGGAEAATELKASNWLPPKFPNSVGYKTFVEVAEKESKGTLKFKVFYGGALLGAKATLDGVRDGVADVGHIVYTYFPAEFRYGELINDLSMVGTDNDAASFALTELQMLHCAPCQEEQRKARVVYLGGYSTPPYVMHSKVDVNSPEALKGKKFRSGGPIWDRWAQFVGGVPVNLPSSDMYEALERGQLDIAIYAAGGIKTHGLGDVAKYVTLLPLGSFRSDSLFTFNRERWRSLSNDERLAIMKAAAAGIVVTNREYAEGDEEGLALARKKKIAVVEPSAEMTQLLDRFIEQDLARTVEHAKTEYGIAEPQPVIDSYKQLYDKYVKLLEPTGKDKDKMTAILWNEVFAKVDPATYSMEK